MESDTLSVFCHKENVIVIVCDLNFDQFIIFTKGNGCKSGLSYICIIFDRCFLSDTILGRHEQIFIIFVLFDRNDGCNLFTWCKLEQVDDGCSSCGTACLRNLVCFDTIYFTGIGKEHQIMVGGGHKQLFDVIVVNGLHSLDALAAAVLRTEIICAHTFDVTQFCHGNNRIGNRDQIFHGNIILVISDGSSSLIAVFCGNLKDLFTDHTEKQFLICKDCF